MSPPDAALARLAARAGIEAAYTDAFGRTREVGTDTLIALLEAMGLPAGSDHQIEASLRALPEPAAEAPGRPARCFSFKDLGRDRLWGLSAQLYGLRSATGWGIGDFGDLAELAEIAARLGAGALGINPLHALFPADPEQYSPYSPSSRQFLNILYIDLRQVPEHRPDWPDRGLRALRAAELVDYRAVTLHKLAALEQAFARFQTDELAPNSERAQRFHAFVAEMGEALRDQARFDALQERHGADWRRWPVALRDPGGAAVTQFAAAHAERVTFHKYLQWLADEQLGQAHRRARAAGMPIGLYRDLAVGLNPGGAAAWAQQQVVVPGVAIGAPPDQFNPLGQNWGLAPLSPHGLALQGYRGLIEDLRQNMRHAGALRIDHVMGLQRLFWIPDGAPPAEGAYVRYPLPAMLRIVAEESRRARCLVIGEDLGTVPPGFRAAMRRARLLSYRLFYFERQKSGALRPPRRYPRNALVAVSTHDLPTLRGFWAGRDLDWRDELALHADAAAAPAARAERVRDQGLILAALRRAGLWQKDAAHGDERLGAAVHDFLATTPARLMMVQLEDALGEVEQANLPGTVAGHPNWRRRLPLPLDALAERPGLQAVAASLARSGRSFNGG